MQVKSEDVSGDVEPAQEPAAAEAEVVETPGGEASETAPPDTEDLAPELADESIEADAQAPDEPGPGDSEGEAPSAPPEAEQL